MKLLHSSFASQLHLRIQVGLHQFAILSSSKLPCNKSLITLLTGAGDGATVMLTRAKHGGAKGEAQRCAWALHLLLAHWAQREFYTDRSRHTPWLKISDNGNLNYRLTGVTARKVQPWISNTLLKAFNIYNWSHFDCIVLALFNIFTNNLYDNQH